MTPTVVMVHGAWHGAWCWEPLQARLASRGIATIAVDLPGHGADPGPLADLYGDADAVRAQLDELDGPVVLVGHSYGGAVISDAGVHPTVAHLVFVAAFALDADETVVGAMAEDEPPAEGGGLTAAIVFADDGSTTLAPGAIADLIYQCCDAETQAWAAARVGPESTSSMVQSPRQVAWRTTPSTYVVCEQDRTVSPTLQRAHAARCTTSVVLDTDHSPFASTPDALAEVIVDLVARVG